MKQQAVDSTSDGFRLFAETLIDYAGLFPPANLDLKTVVNNYANYLKGPYGWMLGKLICPISLLKEMGQQLRHCNLQNRIEVAGLVTKEKTAQDALNEIDSFHKQYGEIAKVTSTESKFLAEFMHSKVLYGTYIEAVKPIDIDWIIDADCKVKLRCGGISPNDFPTVEQLAKMIYIANTEQVAMKFTAGLHHPIRHTSSEMGCKMHGFINVIGAALLGLEHNLSETLIAEILREENPRHFRFDDEGFYWKEWFMDVDAIAENRLLAASSFGSCSFHEPIADLKTLGWLS